MDDLEVFREGLNSKKSNKAQLKYLRSAIVHYNKQIKSLMKDPKKERVIHSSQDGPQPTTNKEIANEKRAILREATKEYNELKRSNLEANPKNQERNRATGETRLKRIKTRSMRGGVSGGGGMATPDDYVRRGRRSLFKQE